MDQNPDGPYNVSGLLTNMYQLVLVMNLKPEKFFTRSIDKLADMGAYGTLPLEKRDKTCLGGRTDDK